MSKFQVEHKILGQKMVLKLIGSLDEDSAFAGVVLGGATEAEVDFTGLDSVNSCGVREWLKWLKTLPKGTKLVYEGCPAFVVEQMNMVAGFLPKGTVVKSIYVPYFCGSCKKQQHMLFTREKEWSGKTLNLPDEIGCPNCKGKMEMDVMEAKYFRFIIHGP